MKDVLGIVFADDQHTKIGDLTNRRPLAAVPVAGRYRCIDFVLSDMVNSGMINIAVVTQNNYHSLMDHLGSGKAWNLSRKKYGLYLFPPYSSPDSTGYDNRIDILYSLLSYLKHSSQMYIFILNLICFYLLFLSKTLDFSAQYLFLIFYTYYILTIFIPLILNVCSLL